MDQDGRGFRYEQCDVPEGMTLREWRDRRAPVTVTPAGLAGHAVRWLLWTSRTRRAPSAPAASLTFHGRRR